MKALRNTLVLFMLPLFLTACPNALSEMAQKTTDEALLTQADIYASQRDWATAISTVARTSTTFQAQRTTKYKLASYYAGSCGLDLLELADALTDGLAAGDTLYEIFLNEYAANTSFADCQTAEDTLFGISTTFASLTPDENVLLAFIEFAKIGSVLASTALVDSGNDGTYDGDIANGGAFDPCSTSDISDVNIGRIGTGVMIAYNALSASGADIASDALGDISGICAAVGGCNETNPSNFSAAEYLALRGLIKSNELGFNSCGGALGSTGAGTANDCHCPVTP